MVGTTDSLRVQSFLGMGVEGLLNHYSSKPSMYLKVRLLRLFTELRVPQAIGPLLVGVHEAEPTGESKA